MEKQQLAVEADVYMEYKDDIDCDDGDDQRVVPGEQKARGDECPAENECRVASDQSSSGSCDQEDGNEGAFGENMDISEGDEITTTKGEGPGQDNMKSRKARLKIRTEDTG